MATASESEENWSNDVLEKAFADLWPLVTGSVDVADVINELHAAGVLPADDFNELQSSANSRRSKVESLLVVLHKSKHERAFVELRRALLGEDKVTKYLELVNELEMRCYEIVQPKSGGETPVKAKRQEEEDAIQSFNALSMQMPPAHQQQQQQRSAQSSTPSKSSSKRTIAVPGVKLAKLLPEEDFAVCAIATLNNELFVCLKEKTSIAVYSTDTFEIQRYLSVPGMSPNGVRDMASCGRFQCLYLADLTTKLIHRIDEAANKRHKWSVNDQPVGLSITGDANVVVTFWQIGKIRVYTTQGDLVREIGLQSNVVHPWHAIQVTADKYVVCHGNGQRDSLNRVCVVDESGRVLHSFGGSAGSSFEQVDLPIRLAVLNGLILVADANNNRLLMLSRTLRYIKRHVLSTAGGYLRLPGGLPERLWFDEQANRLYIARNQVKNAFGQMVTFNPNSKPVASGHVEVYSTV